MVATDSLCVPTVGISYARQGGDERPAEENVQDPPSYLSEVEPVNAEAAEENGEDRGGNSSADPARAFERRLPYAASGADLGKGVDLGPAMDAIFSLFCQR
jgi:hypothetical protein